MDARRRGAVAFHARLQGRISLLMLGRTEQERAWSISARRTDSPSRQVFFSRIQLTDAVERSTPLRATCDLSNM